MPAAHGKLPPAPHGGRWQRGLAAVVFAISGQRSPRADHFGAMGGGAMLTPGMTGGGATMRLRGATGGGAMEMVRLRDVSWALLHGWLNTHDE